MLCIIALSCSVGLICFGRWAAKAAGFGTYFPHDPRTTAFIDTVIEKSRGPGVLAAHLQEGAATPGTTRHGARQVTALMPE